MCLEGVDAWVGSGVRGFGQVSEETASSQRSVALRIPLEMSESVVQGRGDRGLSFRRMVSNMCSWALCAM